MKVLFTDLDGTFLDDHYRPGPALPALQTLIESGVAVVFCSSKTRVEQEHLAAELRLDVDLVVENGGWLRVGNTEQVFGLSYSAVRAGLQAAAHLSGTSVRGYGDMDTAEVARLTGLSPDDASRAMQREHSETFLIERGDASVLERALRVDRLRMMRGTRFFTVQGRHDKGTAVRAAIEILGATESFAVGDAPNDAEMLAAVDHSMLVERSGGGWADVATVDALLLHGIGPQGFVRAAERVLD